MENRSVHLHRLGKILDIEMLPKKDWSAEFTQAPFAIAMGRYHRIFFSTRSKRDEDNNYISHISYIDYDFEKQSIELFANKPIVNMGEIGTFDEHGTYPFSVLKVEEGYIGYYAGWSRKISVPYEVKVGMVLSDDCAEFIKLGNGPVLAASLYEPMTISGPRIHKFNNEFHLFYVAGEKWSRDEFGRAESIFKIRHAVSTDGTIWRRQNQRLIEPVLEEDECQASPTVFFKDGNYHMFFSYKYGSDFRGTSRGYRLGYAVSADLVSWKRSDSRLTISKSESSWDDLDMSYPHAFQIGDDWHLLYQGNNIGKSGFGYARIDFIPQLESNDKTY